MGRRSVWVVPLVLACLCSAVRADAVPDRNERIIGAGRVWAHVKFFHPYLGYKAIDWDAAFVAALPKIEAAKTIAEYKAALTGMLAKLGDPVTHLTTTPQKGGAAPAGDWLTTPSSGLVVIDMAGWVAGGYDYVGFHEKAARASAELAKAKTAVIDLRAPDPSFVPAAVDTFVDALPAIEDWPLERTVEHHGYRTQHGMTSGEYYSAFTVTGARAPKPAPKAGPGHVIVVADDKSPLPAAVLALQAAGRATIVARSLSDEGSITTTTIEAASGVEVQIRLGELLWGPPKADVLVPTGDPRAKALALAKAGPRATPRTPVLANLPQYKPRDDADYADQQLPSRELRVLAGVRVWATLDKFFPYRYLIADWDKALRDALPKLEAAVDREAYLKALTELGVRAGDGHIGVWPINGVGRAPWGSPPIELRLVEGKVAVVRLLDATAAKGFAVGDVIETIDGKPAATLLADKRTTVSGSTDEARDQRAVTALAFGPDGSAVKLGVRGADGKLRETTATRQVAHMQAIWAEPQAPHWKKLAGNVGYVDLRQITVPEVDKMFAELAGTKAIVLDMRGYPKGTAWAIAPRINVKGAKHGAQFLQPYVTGEGSDSELQDARIRFLQPIPKLPPGAQLYRGKIVVLIDDRAISQSEHSCLFYQEAAGATFIGSPTHGANGDVTVMRLPGGFRMSFTGQEVRHVDGKQLQRIGIKPHILVRPTLAGIRAGKDELLDRALAFVATGK